MDEKLVVATIITVASAAIAAYVASTDGREIRETVRQRFTVQNDQFEKALSGAVNGWFVRMVRCDINTFLEPYSGVVFINEVLRCLVHLSKSIFHSPRSVDYWASTAAAFESIAGFPDVIGAVDAAYALYRALCALDQQTINLSGIAPATVCISYSISQQYHLLGDSGYKIWRHLVTPYPDHEATMSFSKRHYNYCHSRTRILVERAFGSLKNRWRVLLRKLDQKSEETLRNTIVSCFVLHNLMIDLNDSVVVGGDDPFVGLNIGLADTFVHTENMEAHVDGKKKREILTTYLTNIHSR
ncbi:hypothetical protein AC1031_019598 [Aphanomyces cochlioides]|nr:hypothetical protein AC1031_019598 [Aphanomyces cochlioides]